MLNSYGTVSLLEARLLNLRCFFIEEHLWWPIFEQKFAGTGTEIYPHLGGTSSDFGGHGHELPPVVQGLSPAW